MFMTNTIEIVKNQECKIVINDSIYRKSFHIFFQFQRSF